MRVQKLVAIGVLMVVLSLLPVAPIAKADPVPVPPPTPARTEDLTARLQEIYDLRARWILTDDTPPDIERDYMPKVKTARWALEHEYGKIKYMKAWTQNRKVRFVHSKPTIKVKQLRVNEEKARFYVEQSHSLGYVYPNEEQVNMFGVGTRHIIELKRSGEQWLINMEWYTDPLGDDTEVPDVTPALMPWRSLRQRAPAFTGTSAFKAASIRTEATDGKDFRSGPPRFLDAKGAATLRGALEANPIGPVATAGYDREGAVAYADKYCGVAWGCGNEHRYNPRFRDYNGVGGDCTNYVSQVLRDGGGLKMPIFTRVDGLAGHIQYSGRGSLAAKGPYHRLVKVAQERPGGFPAWLKLGDAIAYQEKGEMAHFAVITGFDNHGYPLVNSHTADRYHVPFDLGWDKKTIYWLFKLRD